jgi:putative transposase
MNFIDKEFTRCPYRGVPSMTAYLRNLNKNCGYKKVRRLMRIMGLEAIYFKPNTSRSNNQHKVYPYLLENIDIKRPNQVWATDITYIRLLPVWLYLWTGIGEVSFWRLSNTIKA